jgi:hypothetical protein
MPGDRFTKKADTPKAKRTWDHVYKSAKEKGAKPSSAIKQANAAVRDAKKSKSK